MCTSIVSYRDPSSHTISLPNNLGGDRERLLRGCVLRITNGSFLYMGRFDRNILSIKKGANFLWKVF
jgi:hypothetical protein